MSLISHTSIRDSQSFLKDSRLAATLITRCELSQEDVVYEIGPGKGTITAQLAHRCKKVIAIEKDPILSALLARNGPAYPNVTIHNGDFLEHPLPRYPYKVFSNIPFNITSAIVTRLTTAPNPPEDAYLFIQKEAAEMYLGRPSETLRSVLLKPWFEMEIVHSFHRHDFTPVPSVDVVLLRLRKRQPPLVNHANRQSFRDFVAYTFTTWRPTLGAILKDVFSWGQLKQISREFRIDLGVTPTGLRFEQWLHLFKCYQLNASPRARGVIAGSERRLHHQQKRLQKIHRTRNGAYGMKVEI